jgi:hypothetical protein
MIKYIFSDANYGFRNYGIVNRTLANACASNFGGTTAAESRRISSALEMSSPVALQPDWQPQIGPVAFTNELVLSENTTEYLETTERGDHIAAEWPDEVGASFRVETPLDSNQARDTFLSCPFAKHDPDRYYGINKACTHRPGFANPGRLM